MSGLRVLAFALLVPLLLPTPLHAQTPTSKVPDNWLALGVAAALEDDAAGVLSITGYATASIFDHVPSDRAPELIDRLLALLTARNGPDDTTSRYAPAALVALAGKVPSDKVNAVIDKLLSLLVHSQNAVRAAAVKALIALGQSDHPESVLNKVLPLLAHPKSTVRAGAAEVMGPLTKGDNTTTAINRLLPLLSDKDSNVRQAAATSLLEIEPGDRATSVVTTLLPRLSDADLNVRIVAAKALIVAGRKKVTVTRSRLGIGVQLVESPEANQVLLQYRLKVTALELNSPAAKTGIQVGDLISHIDGHDIEALFQLGFSFSDMVELLTGPAGTSVQLTIERQGKGDHPLNVTLVRTNIQTPSFVPGDHATAAIDTLVTLAQSGNRQGDAAAALKYIDVDDVLPANRFDKIAALMHNDSSDVRSAAAALLAGIGKRGSADTALDKLLPALADTKSVADSARLSLVALGKGDLASRVVDKVLRLRASPNATARANAVRTLGWLILERLPQGTRTTDVINALQRSLMDADNPVRLAGANAIEIGANAIASEDNGRLGSIIDKLALLALHDSDEDISADSVAALQELGKVDRVRASVVIDKLLPLLAGHNTKVRNRVAQALTDLGQGQRVIDKLLPLLHDNDKIVRRDAAQTFALIPLGEGAGVVIERLLPLLRDSQNSVKNAAAETLGAIGKGNGSAAIADKLLPLLDNADTSASALQGLVIAPPVRSQNVIDKLVPLLVPDPYYGPNLLALTTLDKIGPGGISSAFVAIRLTHERAAASTVRLRAAAHIVTGADAKNEHAETLLAWLGRPARLPLEIVTNHPARANEVLALFLQHWSELSTNDSLRDEAENAVMRIVYAACPSSTQPNQTVDLYHAVMAWLRYLPPTAWRACWNPQQKQTIVQLLQRFKEKHSTHEQALAAHLASEGMAPVTNYLTVSVIGWTLLWATFLIAFPWSPTVQAMFFWNVRMRQGISLWFVPLLLLVFPVLRQRILQPFRDDLIGAAQPKTFSRLGYFNRTRARLDGGPPAPVETLLAEAQGTVVIRGEAGLGKTSLLRWLAISARRPVAFLHARECDEGVDVAIARMIRQIQEAGFVRSMVHTRAMVIIIDGLNEVSADTREKVGSFTREMSKGDIFIGTQPIEWLPPKGAKVIDLLPLGRGESRDFLLSRPVASDTTQNRHGDAYAQAVDTFIRQALDEAPTEDDLRAAALMLSNPFDLSLASELLAEGTMPRATALIDAAFRLADECSAELPGYRTLAGQPFPLVRFGYHAVAMRLEDRNWFKEDEFPAETACLLRWKLVIPRALKSARGVTERLQFRHDRVWDFFIAAAFRTDPDLWAKHIQDSRFRGAYLRIAETWDRAHATQVRDKLIMIAAHSGDHTTSDEFVKRLEARQQTVDDSQLPGLHPAA